MLNAISRLFGKPVSAQANSVETFSEEDIPRYPPFAKGLPVAPIDKVVETQRDLVERIRNALGFTREQHEKLLLPVIKRYAEFVHLLPASEAHHHRGAGGLFRHGLEVAFWVAQASEAVIFSMEGSPRERRNNEPRWRLASCLSGLLHDVGKPLSDVSVTDKDGAVTWNPYANSLYGWAQQNQIDHYFLRWRDNRHKRHEQFSLLTIERIIPADALEFLSEAGPEILEGMLEAIAGTSTNQPITRLMLKADQESVARDLKQSRLDVDEFSYGVPVERYVFDGIRRLVKTGKWKVNEPGARVWHVHQGVFITWRQLGDLYELITKDKIPGIPRDPDTLADILIERGFAIPNVVASDQGEQAQYRYWELCPELLQEGRPAGSVKLMVLRLESNELVFTTEPPAPVNATLIGESSEPSIEFESLDAGSQEGQNGDDQPGAQETTEEPGEASQESSDQTEAESDKQKDSGANFQDAYEVIASVTSQQSDNSNDSPLDGLLNGDSSASVPLSIFGMEEPKADSQKPAEAPKSDALEQSSAVSESDEAHEEAPRDAGEPEQQSVPESQEAQADTAPTEQTSPSGITAPSEQSSSENIDDPAGDFDLSNLFPGTKAKAKSKARKQENSPKQSKKPEMDKPTVKPEIESVTQASSAPEKQVGPGKPTPSLQQQEVSSKSESLSDRDALAQTLSAFPDKARGLLERAILPVVDGEMELGDTLFMLNHRPAIVFPEGAERLGEPTDVLNTLWEAKAIAEDPVVPGKKIQSDDRYQGLVLIESLGSLVRKALSGAEAAREESQEAVLAGFLAGMTRKANTRKKFSAGAKKNASVEQKQATTPTRKQASSAKPRKPQASSASSKQPGGEQPPKQNAMRVRPPSKQSSRTKAQETKKPVAKKEVVIPEIEESQILSKGKSASDDQIAEITPKQVTPAQAIAKLKDMMIKGEGRWLVEPVRTEQSPKGKSLVTSGKSFEVIAGEFADISKAALRGHLNNGQKRPFMFYKQGKLHLLIEDNRQ